MKRAIFRNMRVIGVILLLIVGITASIGNQRVFGSGIAAVSFSPATSSHDNGDTFSVTVYEDSSSQAVDAVSVAVSFDTTKLQLVTATNGTAFTLCVTPTQSAGKVSFGCTMTGSGSLSGKQAVGSLTLKALVGSGSTAITTSGATAIIRHSDGQNIWNGNNAASSVTLTTPAPPVSPPVTPPVTTSTQPTTPTSTDTSTSTTSTDSDSFTLPSFTTDTPLPVDVTDQTGDPDAPVPVASEFQSIGNNYMVGIKVVDKHGKALSHVRVKLNGQTVTSDNTGLASFTSVPIGDYKVTVSDGTTTLTRTIKVPSDLANSDPGKVNQFEVKLTAKHANNTAAAGITGSVVLLLIAGVLFFGWQRGLLHRFYTPVVARVNALPEEAAQLIVPAKPPVTPVTDAESVVITPTAPVNEAKPAATHPDPPAPSQPDGPSLLARHRPKLPAPGQIFRPSDHDSDDDHPAA